MILQIEIIGKFNSNINSNINININNHINILNHTDGDTNNINVNINNITNYKYVYFDFCVFIQ